MKIRMLTTQRGAEDGVTLRTYEAGQVYDLVHTPGQRDLAAVFVRERWAVEVAPAPARPEGSAPMAAAVEAAPAPAPAPRAEARPQGRRGRGA